VDGPSETKWTWKGSLYSGIKAGKKKVGYPTGRNARDSYGDESQKAQKIEDQQKGRHSSGAMAEWIEDNG
jgi:hypothetical protein